MSLKQQTDQIFAEDPVTIPLKERLRAHLERLQTATGERLSPALMPVKPPPHWSEEARALLEAYQSISKELSRLNSRRESQRLSRFLKAANGETEMSDATRRWWLNRY